MTDEQAKPWYRYFYPWLVIALLGAAVSGSLVTLYIASSTSEPVLPEYHEQQ